MKIHHITEDLDNDTLLEIEEKLKETPFIKNNNAPLYHGTEVLDIDTFDVVQHKARKKPRNTMLTLHKKIGGLLKDKLGTNIREDSIFCYKSHKTPSYYGVVYTVVPVGDYKMWASDTVYDMTTDLNLDPNMFRVSGQAFKIYTTELLKSLPEEYMNNIERN